MKDNQALRSHSAMSSPGGDSTSSAVAARSGVAVNHKIFEHCQDASKSSHDPNTQVGCIFVRPETDEIIASGSNTLVKGCKRTDKRVTRPDKYKWIEHAERNAIYAAARKGVSLNGSLAYVTMWPCMECARAIVQAGSIGVVAASRPDLDDDRWGDQFRLTLELFDDVGLQYKFVDEEEKI